MFTSSIETFDMVLLPECGSSTYMTVLRSCPLSTEGLREVATFRIQWPVRSEAQGKHPQQLTKHNVICSTTNKSPAIAHNKMSNALVAL